MDQRVAFVGGMDLCEGRFDDASYALGDADHLVYPGVEFYQPNKAFEDEDRARTPSPTGSICSFLTRYLPVPERGFNQALPNDGSVFWKA